MKAIRFLLVLGLMLAASTVMGNTQPEVTNVAAMQRPHTALVDVTYDLADADGDLCHVSLWYSLDGGASWDHECVTVWGDVGPGIMSGEGLSATWDAGVDLADHIDQQFLIRVYADDGSIGGVLTYGSGTHYWTPDANNVTATVTVRGGSGGGGGGGGAVYTGFPVYSSFGGQGGGGGGSGEIVVSHDMVFATGTTYTIIVGVNGGGGAGGGPGQNGQPGQMGDISQIRQGEIILITAARGDGGHGGQYGIEGDETVGQGGAGYPNGQDGQVGEDAQGLPWPQDAAGGAGGVGWPWGGNGGNGGGVSNGNASGGWIGTIGSPGIVIIEWSGTTLRRSAATTLSQ